VYVGGKASSISAGIELCREVIRNGRAWEKFRQLVQRQGGRLDVIDIPELYPRSSIVREIKAVGNGFVSAIDALELGFVGIMLGAGRMKVDDIIDPKAGIILQKKIGDAVKQGETIATVYTNDDQNLKAALSRVEKAFSYTPQKATARPLIYSMVDSLGVHEWKSVP
jgi:thymidine phosphorylase